MVILQRLTVCSKYLGSLACLFFGKRHFSMSTNPTETSSTLTDVAMEVRDGESFRGANTSHVRATSNAVFPIVPTVSKAVVRWKIFFMETTPGVSFRA